MTSRDSPGNAQEGLTPGRAVQLAGSIATSLGLSPNRAELIKFTVNAVVRMSAAGVVIRIAGSQTAAQRIPTVLAAATWLAEHHQPVVRLFPAITQPVTCEGRPATVWLDARHDGPAPTAGDLGRILRGIHTISSPPPARIPDWNPIATIRARIAEAASADVPDLDEDTRSFLASATDDAEADLARLGHIPPLIPAGLIHGDAHVGNLIPSSTGAVICDFDSTRIGPREWDLTPTAVGTIRFAYGIDRHHDLAAAYGTDVTTWQGFPTLRRLRELQLVTSVMPNLAANPRLRPQWRHRLDTFRAGDDAFWTPYADIT